jgi:hypothetical protein
VDEHSDAIDASATSSRRDILKKAAVGGTIAWVAPAILASRAGAQGTCNGLLADWDTIAIPPIGWRAYINGQTIGSTGFTGSNIDVVAPTFATTPPWSAGHNWVDLVSTGAAGSITAEYEIPCTATYELEFVYSSYNGQGETVTVDVDGVNSGPLPVPGPGSPATFLQGYGQYTAGDLVTITISGTGAAAVGPALGNVRFGPV